MTPPGSRFDAIVVGGGPGGSSAARRLAQRGLTTLLLERSSMPRRKLCGGAVSAQATSYLDFTLPRELIDAECYGARVHFAGRTVEGRLASRIAVLVTRARFDQHLAEMAARAGATVRFEKVRTVVPAPGHVTVETDAGAYRSSVVVVAAGANHRFCGLVRPRDDANRFAVTQEVEIPRQREDRFADLRELVDIHFGVARYGYGWVFHHGRHYSVGVGGLRSKLRDPAGAMREFLDSVGLRGTYPGLKGHPIPRGGLVRPHVADRVVLVGDAAGFVDPFYGEGIAYAIRSGQLAGDVIGEIHQRGRECTAARLVRYTSRCEAEFQRNLRYSLLLSRMMYRFPGVFLRLFVSDRRFLQKYLEIPLHRLSYRGFLAWMIPRLPWYVTRSLLASA